MCDMIISLYSSSSCGQPHNYSDNKYYYHVLNSGTPISHVPPSTPAEYATINTTRCCIENSPPEKPRVQSLVSKFNHNVDSDKADSDMTFVETAMVLVMSGSVTPEPEY